jgi:ACT domain-containing protein
MEDRLKYKINLPAGRKEPDFIDAINTMKSKIAALTGMRAGMSVKYFEFNKDDKNMIASVIIFGHIVSIDIQEKVT